jgi:hypothetical protein
MTDREKVIKGLECCTFILGKRKCNECPYQPDNGCYQLQDDFHALLKEQEPRVMTLDELTEIYVEFKNDICQIRLTNFDLQKIVKYAVDGDCRLWTGKPTVEQMKAVKWDA